MKSFKIYINEANYLRFLKGNKNLTPDQRKKINDYFSKENRQGGAEIEWQSKKIKNMYYQDFEDIIISYKSGFKKIMKVNVPGKENEDYLQVKLKNKKFLAYIPLNYKSAKFFNSKEYGKIESGYCIGWKYGDKYWQHHIIQEQKIPIYLINGEGKWVIIIKKNNNSYEIWNKLNQEDLAKKNKEPIPEFNIQKELLSAKLKKIYDKIRNNEIDKRHFIEKADISKDANYEIDGDRVIWHNGTWYNGTWEDGVWEGGIWKRGTWKRGTWKKGYWEFGTWEKGTWEKGTWIDGTWEDGTWEGGKWEKGIWEKGIWEKGTWWNGTWWDGTWEYGTWKNGKWLGGIWKKGWWENGRDKDGNYHLELDSPNRWKK